MALAALALCLVYAFALFGVPGVLQRLRTGSSGWVAGSTPAEHLANALFVVAWLLDLLAPLLVLAGATEPIGALENPVARATGIALLVGSVGLGVLAQRTMGSAWKTGIDPGRPPEQLVRGGLFVLCRNPVYTTMLAASAGVALLVPTAIAPLAVGTCLLALQIQTRLVEEPHLRAAHGNAYADYASHVGRFLPGIGRLRG